MIERATTENKSYMIVCVVVKSLYTLRQLHSTHRLSHAINILYTATLLALPKYIRLTVPRQKPKTWLGTLAGATSGRPSSKRPFCETHWWFYKRSWPRWGIARSSGHRAWPLPSRSCLSKRTRRGWVTPSFLTRTFSGMPMPRTCVMSAILRMKSVMTRGGGARMSSCKNSSARRGCTGRWVCGGVKCTVDFDLVDPLWFIWEFLFAHSTSVFLHSKFLALYTRLRRESNAILK